MGTWCRGSEFTVHKLKPFTSTPLDYEKPELSVLEPIWLTRCHPPLPTCEGSPIREFGTKCSHTKVCLQSCMTWLGWGSSKFIHAQRLETFSLGVGSSQLVPLAKHS